MNQQDAGRLVLFDESRKLVGHGGEVSGNQHPSGVGGDLKNFLIRCAVGDHASGIAEIDRGFPSAQPSPYFRVQVRVGLKAEASS